MHVDANVTNQHPTPTLPGLTKHAWQRPSIVLFGPDARAVSGDRCRHLDLRANGGRPRELSTPGLIDVVGSTNIFYDEVAVKQRIIIL